MISRASRSRSRRAARAVTPYRARRLRAVAARREPESLLGPVDRPLLDFVERALVVALCREEFACAFAHDRQIGRHVALRFARSERSGADHDQQWIRAADGRALEQQSHAVAGRSRSTETLRYAARPVELGVDRALQASTQVAVVRRTAEDFRRRGSARGIRCGGRGGLECRRRILRPSRLRRRLGAAASGHGDQCDQQGRTGRTRVKFSPGAWKRRAAISRVDHAGSRCRGRGAA